MTNDTHRTIRWGIAAATIILLPLTARFAADDAPATPSRAACDSDFSCMGDASLHDSDADRPSCAEDDPCWDCSTMGNRVCGKHLDKDEEG